MQTIHFILIQSNPSSSNHITTVCFSLGFQLETVSYRKVPSTSPLLYITALKTTLKVKKNY